MAYSKYDLGLIRKYWLLKNKISSSFLYIMFERNEFRIFFLHFLNTLYMLLLKMLVKMLPRNNTCFMKFSKWYNNQNPMTGTFKQ